MTNEEIVALIQSGERDRLLELWGQVERYVARQANRWPGEFEDLYQSGFLAMVAAVESYNPTEGYFISWLALHLKTAFNEANGYRSNRQRRDPIHTASSLDTPVGDDEDGATLGDLQSDPDSAKDFETAEDRIWQEQLHTALETALGTLPADQAATLRDKFYHGMTLSALAEREHTTTETIRRLESKGLKALRNPRISMALREFIEERTPYYLHVGVDRFNATHASAVEELVMLRERLGYPSPRPHDLKR